MRVRKIEGTDLPEVFRWFSSRRWPLPPIENAAPSWGFLVEKEGVAQACVWVYFTGRALAFLDWVGTKPEIKDQEAMQALEVLVEGVKDFVGQTNSEIKALCFYTQNAKLADRFESFKFKKESEYFRLLWNVR